MDLFKHNLWLARLQYTTLVMYLLIESYNNYKSWEISVIFAVGYTLAVT